MKALALFLIGLPCRDLRVLLIRKARKANHKKNQLEVERYVSFNF
jgi:hypothetical protein